MTLRVVAFRGVAAVAVTAVTAAAATGVIAAGTAVAADSVVLSYLAGASPYSGIGRYDGSATCTAFLLETDSRVRFAEPGLRP